MHNLLNYLYRLTTFVAFFLLSTHLLAAPAPIDTATLDQDATKEKNLGLGFTLSTAQRPFVGVDNQTTTLPYVSFNYKDFYIAGTNIGFHLLRNEKASFGLLATPRFYEVEPAFAKNGELDGIDKTNPTYLAGLTFQYRTDIAALTAQALTDLKESDGNEVVLSASKTFSLSTDFKISPSIGLTYQDAKLVDHFYGVQAHEARAGRPAYAGKSSVNYNVTLTAFWDISKHFQFLGQVKYESLGSGITDSPIVDEKNIGSATVGLVYYFE